MLSRDILSSLLRVEHDLSGATGCSAQDVTWPAACEPCPAPEAEARNLALASQMISTVRLALDSRQAQVRRMLGKRQALECRIAALR